MVSKRLVIRTINNLVGDVVVGCGDNKGIVVLVGGLLATDVFLRDADAKADSLALSVDGVARRPVGAPAGAQPFLVGELY